LIADTYVINAVGRWYKDVISRRAIEIAPRCRNRTTPADPAAA